MLFWLKTNATSKVMIHDPMFQHSCLVSSSGVTHFWALILIIKWGVNSFRSLNELWWWQPFYPFNESSIKPWLVSNELRSVKLPPQRIHKAYVSRINFLSKWLMKGQILKMSPLLSSLLRILSSSGGVFQEGLQNTANQIKPYHIKLSGFWWFCLLV